MMGKTGVLVFVFFMLITVAMYAQAGEVKVPVETDVITLRNGRVVKGSILCKGPKNIIVLSNDKEIELDTDQVVDIQQGDVSPYLQSYVTADVNGTEKIVRKGKQKTNVGDGVQADNREKKTSQSSTPQKRKKSPPKKREKKTTVKNIPRNVKKKVHQLLSNPAVLKQLRNIKDPAQLDKILKKYDISKKDVKKILDSLHNKNL